MAVQDTTESGTKLELSKATLTLQLGQISGEQLTTMSVMLHAMFLLEWSAGYLKLVVY